MDKTHPSPVELLRSQFDAATILAAASELLMEQLRTRSDKMEDSSSVMEYFRLRLSNIQRELFGVMFLDTKLQVIDFEIMFQGTLSATTVYPREIIRRALELNAASIVIGHNHPSGDLEPSFEDRHLTTTIGKICESMSIRLLDHIIVSHAGTRSFAAQGLI